MLVVVCVRGARSRDGAEGLGSGGTVAARGTVAGRATVSSASILAEHQRVDAVQNVLLLRVEIVLKFDEI